MNRRALAFTLLLGFSCAAFAHHGEGMKVPQTLFSGAVGGVAHPVLDTGHLGFVLALGALAWRSARPLALVAVFTVFTLAGAAAHLSGIEPLEGPALSIAMALTAVLAGIAACVPVRQLPGFGTYAAVAIAGLLHGSAYAESVDGASLPIVVAYFAGVFLVQTAIAVAAWLAVRWWARSGAGLRAERSAGIAAVLLGGAAALIALGR